jgi:hypothetical protein
MQPIDSKPVTESAASPNSAPVSATTAAAAKALNLDPEHLRDALVAALHSVYVTGAAVLAALVVGSVSAGADTFPAFLAFAKINWWIATVGVVAPSIRGHIAYRTAATTRDGNIA